MSKWIVFISGLFVGVNGYLVGDIKLALAGTFLLLVALLLSAMQ